ncbi:MAG TPA: extracellular solute-binding protein [Acetobacteraceae bacterium]|jgi:multiple sugar transport system substrate-binding protein|nr:extracellular solute-binding protein [Acetobacteraceae bacterium]
MRRIHRRSVLKLSGASGLATGGGLAGILASGRAPAYAQGTSLHWLKFVDFVPVSDQLLRGKLKDECQKALGISLNIETINGDGIQARITSAIQSKAGPDVMMAVSNWAQLYADSLVDVSDIADDIGKAQGGYFATSRAVANDGKKWIAMPFTILGVQFTNRTSWFAEEGITPDKFPKTWEEYRAVGKKLKAKNRPLGQTLAHAFGDGPAFWYPFMWSWGGKEVEADGKTVVLNSKATIESVKFAVGMWKDAFDEGGMSWDDAGNNRALLANTISSTHNGASIYLLARSKPDTYMTETGKPLKDDIFHSPLPAGPVGQYSYHVPFSNLVPAYGKNQKAAKEFLRWFHSNEVYDAWFTSQQGFSVGITKAWEANKVWQVDPVMAPFRTAAESGQFAGYAGPAGRAAAETISKFIIVDMYAKAVQGLPAEDAVKWAHSELLKIYV